MLGNSGNYNLPYPLRKKEQLEASFYLQICKFKLNLFQAQTSEDLVRRPQLPLIIF